MPDSDGDGVPDAIDLCPDEPGPIENGGCPLPPEEPYDCDSPPEAATRFFGPANWKSGRVILVLRRAADETGQLTRVPVASVYDRLLADFAELEAPKRLVNLGMLAVGADVETVKKLLLDGAVAGIYPVRIYQLEPMLSEDVSSWGLDAIDAREGLDGVYEPRATGQGVHVYVVDTGLDPNHSEFAGRVGRVLSAFGGDGYDGHGHGTHVAGTIGGTHYGVANAVTVNACKALSDQGSGTTEQVAWCIDQGIGLMQELGAPMVGNMSLGGSPDPALDAAVCRAYDAGMPYAIAAGNDYGASACSASPARVKQSLTAMASTRDDQLASFSNDGPCADLIAPGEDIVSARPGGGSQPMSGTSMASPHGAGALAQCLELNAGLGVGCIEEVLSWATEDRISGVPDDTANTFLFVGKAEGPPDVEMLLRTGGPHFVLFTTGERWALKGSIRCCAPDDPDEPTSYHGWPLVSIEWVDYTADVGMNAVHMRPGPFLTANEAEAAGVLSIDPTWASEIGGPYVEVDGKADLTRWNPRFWEELDRIVAHARTRGVWVEVGVGFGGWRAERGRRREDDPGFVPHPWHPKWNVQGEDHISNTVNPTMNDPVHRAWSNKLIHALGKYDHILWFNGNEWTKGIHPDRTEALRAFVLEREQAYGYPVHVFGTNGGPETWNGSADYIEDHTKGEPLASPIAGKPSAVNEYNPRTPLTAEQLFANWCAAQENDTHYWAWRHSMSAAEFDRALRLIAAGNCGIEPTDCPFNTPTASWMKANGRNCEVVPVREGRKGFGFNVKCDAWPAVAGVPYYCQEGLWPERCIEGRSDGPVAPPGHPMKPACEAAFLQQPCATFGYESDAHMSFDPWICINASGEIDTEDCVNQNHPRNVEVCGQGQFEDHWSWEREWYQGKQYIVGGQWSWATAHGDGTVTAAARGGLFKGSVRYVEP